MRRLRQKMLESVKACIMGVSAFAHRHIALTLVFAMCCGIISVPVIRDIRLPATILGIPSFFYSQEGMTYTLPRGGTLYYLEDKEMALYRNQKNPLEQLDDLVKVDQEEAPDLSMYDASAWMDGEKSLALVKVRILQAKDYQTAFYADYLRSEIRYPDQSDARGYYMNRSVSSLALVLIEEVVLNEADYPLFPGKLLMVSMSEYNQAGYVPGSVWYVSLQRRDEESYQEYAGSDHSFYQDLIALWKTHQEYSVSQDTRLINYPVADGYVYADRMVIPELEPVCFKDPAVGYRFAYPEKAFSRCIENALRNMPVT